MDAKDYYQITHARGHKIYQYEEDGDWFYEDGTPCTKEIQKPCTHCGLTPLPWGKQEKTTSYPFTEVNLPMDWGPDPCLGVLDDVRAACCGHGMSDGYIWIESTREHLEGKKVQKYIKGVI